MNSGYFTNPTFPGVQTNVGTPNQQSVPSMEQMITGDQFLEQSYIENILRLNKGKIARFYMSFPDSVEWRDRVFTGTIEAAGRDHIVISDPNTGIWYLLRIIYLNYVEFDEKINYSPSFGQIGQTR
ncbi:MAG TPA: spore coat protein GerQ [Mollicutes bacterium]|jgi:spore germination protein Q|nr:spore coat protein GerQ [Mollicutes bacterium]